VFRKGRNGSNPRSQRSSQAEEHLERSFPQIHRHVDAAFAGGCLPCHDSQEIDLCLTIAFRMLYLCSDFSFRLLGFGSWILNWMDFECWMLDIGFWILEFEFWRWR
jgi:hypothetical protein